MFLFTYRDRIRNDLVYCYAICIVSSITYASYHTIYILVSYSVESTILKSGILPFHSLFYSDHSPCYVDIDTFLQLYLFVASLTQNNGGYF